MRPAIALMGREFFFIPNPSSCRRWWPEEAQPLLTGIFLECQSDRQYGLPSKLKQRCQKHRLILGKLRRKCATNSLAKSFHSGEDAAPFVCYEQGLTAKGRE